MYNRDLQNDTLAVLFHRGKTPMASWETSKDALMDLVKCYELLVFDFDRTIAPFSSSEIYDELDGFVDELKYDHPNVSIALLSNQGGVVYGYSTVEQAKNRVYSGALEFGISKSAVYIAWGIKYKGVWTIPEGMKLGDLGTTPEERKPNGDLLRKIMKDFGVEPEDTLMIGDSLTDIGAAKAAGCDGLLVKMERY